MTITRLLQKIQSSLRSEDPQRAAEEHRRAIQLATAGLLLDVANADQHLDDAERRSLLTHLTERFELDSEAAAELMTAADEARNKTIDHFAFTQLLRKNVGLEERLEMIRAMWRIVFSDGRLTPDEESLVRKLSDLLGIEHHLMIEQKLAARRDLGLATS